MRNDTFKKPIFEFVLLKISKNVKLSSSLISELKNKIILITGGAGSIGSSLTKKLLEYPIRAVRVLDIDEHALFRLKRETDDNSKLRLLLGSILDKERLNLAGNNVDIVLHVAAIKNIEISEYNPIETVEINTIGTINMIKMALNCKPKKFLNISTDKAAEPSTLYGTTKQLGERLVTWAGNLGVPIKFGTIRFGNVIESRGNVFEVWNDESEKKLPLSITDPRMTRYFFHKEDAVKSILESLLLINKGEIIVPKMKKYKIQDLAKKYSKKYKITGIRQGEKLHEILMTDKERKIALEKKGMWVIKPIR